MVKGWVITGFLFQVHFSLQNVTYDTKTFFFCILFGLDAFNLNPLSNKDDKIVRIYENMIRKIKKVNFR